MLAHIAGVPIEETVLAFSPVIATAGGIAGVLLRRLTPSARRQRNGSSAGPQR